MYQLSMPLMMSNPRFEDYIAGYAKQCQEAGCHRIFLCVCMCVASEEYKDWHIAMLEKYVPYLKNMGFEVGAWMSSLGHGGSCEINCSAGQEKTFTLMKNTRGQECAESYCPTDPEFQREFKDWIQRLARTGVELIMLDDDYRYSLKGPGFFCCCEEHVKLLEKELGEPFDGERMEKALTEGGPNPWRDAWLKVQGEVLNDFAKELRKALDEVRPEVRLGHCAVMSTWDLDGVDSVTLAKSFAGNTRPFLRLIGCPYWVTLGACHEIRLGAVCDYERLQQAWCKDSGVELFTEGDVYPRPSYTVPAANLELFDQVMIASGTCDGILKYMLDYTSSPNYETAYLKHHGANQELREKLAEAFAGKEAVGLRLFAPMKNFSVSHDPINPEARLIPAGTRFASANSLPVCFGKTEDAALIFGTAAELAEEELLENGAVLDLEAAKILSRRGVDVGLGGIGERFGPTEETFVEEQEVASVAGGTWMKMELKPGAKAESWLSAPFEGKTGEQVPAAYTYENAKGQRFLVYGFQAWCSEEGRSEHGIFRGWCRAAQLRRILSWLSGKELDAVCAPAPDLYMLVKKNREELTVGLWNFGMDKIFAPEVTLGEEYEELLSVWGEAKMQGRKVLLGELPAYSCACFTVKKKRS